MAAARGAKSVGPPAGRAIAIEVVDAQGRPAGGATIAVSIDQHPAGTIDSGSGSDRPFVLFVGNPSAAVDIEVSVSGSVQQMRLTAAVSSARFVFPVLPTFMTKRPPRLTCPDGSTGYPCVTCTDGAVSWRMCA
jgi:hypothetical protein